MVDLGGIFWMAMTIVAAMVGVSLFMVYRYVIEPPIARKMTKAKFAKGSPAFIQNDAGRVIFTINDNELPEGVVHNQRGWFLRSRSPYIPLGAKKRGRKGKNSSGEDSETESIDATDEKMLETILEAPILEGLGKAVFFGYDGSPLLSNLKTLAHADLKKMKEIIPATVSRTQLGALHRWSVAKGYEKRGGEGTKIIILAIACATVIATVGLVFWFISK